MFRSRTARVDLNVVYVGGRLFLELLDNAIDIMLERGWRATKPEGANEPLVRAEPGAKRGLVLVASFHPKLVEGGDDVQHRKPLRA